MVPDQPAGFPYCGLTGDVLLPYAPVGAKGTRQTEDCIYPGYMTKLFFFFASMTSFLVSYDFILSFERQFSNTNNYFRADPKLWTTYSDLCCCKRKDSAKNG